MPHSFEQEKSAATGIPFSSGALGEPLRIEPLTDENEPEALAFLSTSDSVQAIFMVGLIRDNGIESPFNRGRFYGARRPESGGMVGVALIGHATLVETSDRNALEEFARLAGETAGAHVHLGEEETIRHFWSVYSRGGGQRPRLVCREMLFELRAPSESTGEVCGLRPATLSDLPLVMPAQAAMALEESGVDPMESDPVGFRLRCARRIEQGRVFVWVEAGRLLFKADILADTESSIYLEGVYTDPCSRNQAYGSKCLAILARALLARSRSIMLLVNEENHRAQDFYRRAGFRFSGYYDTIFLQTGFETNVSREARGE
jgi:ribosomal protein S18 acetylase RimI-like enzyme